MTQHYLLQALFTRSLHLVVLWRQLPFMKNSKCAAPSRSVTVLSCSFFGAPDPIRRWMEFLKLIWLYRAPVAVLNSLCALITISFYYRDPVAHVKQGVFCCRLVAIFAYSGIV